MSVRKRELHYDKYIGGVMDGKPIHAVSDDRSFIDFMVFDSSSLHFHRDAVPDAFLPYERETYVRQKLTFGDGDGDDVDVVIFWVSMSTYDPSRALWEVMLRAARIIQ